MKVKDLIEKLKQFDEDTSVMVCDMGLGEASFEVVDAEYYSFNGRVVDLLVKEI